MLELLVSMTIAGVAMAGIYSTYSSQQKSRVAQEQLTVVKQNLRSALYYIEREIRLAGLDPNQKAGAGILNMGWDAVENRYTSLNFTLDTTDDTGTGPPDGDTTDPNENITYTLTDSDSDGDNDLERNGLLIAENIDALDFVYLKGDGTLAANAAGIRSIQVTLVARTDNVDLGFQNSTTYLNQQGTPIYAANDSFRRRLISTDIKCRNLGL